MLKSPKYLIKSVLNHTAARFGHHCWPNRQPKLWLLMYHRILPESDPRFSEEEPGMVVTPETFASHLSILREFFEIVSLPEWLERVKDGKRLPPKACAITFDDGWRDNYQYALPILKQTHTPATVFAVAKMIGTERQFWPNRIAHLCKHHLQLLRELPEASWLLKQFGAGGPSTNREQIAFAINACKAETDNVIECHLDRIESLINSPPASQPALMNWQQLAEMSDSGLIEIGSHTCTHRRLLSTLPPETLEQEVVESQSLLEHKLQRPVRLFCYPNGDVSPQGLQLVRQHYDAAVTTQRGINVRTTDPYQLNRIGIHEDMCSNRTRFLARLSGWM